MATIKKHNYEWITERIDKMDNDAKPIDLIDLPKSSCGALVFYATSKKNMKNIMRDGIRTDSVSGYIKDRDIKIEGNSIVMACLPQEKIYLHKTDRARFHNKDEPFSEWDAMRMEWEDRGDGSDCSHKPLFLGHRTDIKLKDIIPTESIIGCIDVVKINNLLKLKINRNCDY